MGTLAHSRLPSLVNDVCGMARVTVDVDESAFTFTTKTSQRFQR